MQLSKRRRALAGLAVAVTATTVLVTGPAASAHGKNTTVTQVNLVSDQPGKAAITDPNLINAWGLSRGPNTPVWVSDAGTGVSTLYRGAIPGTPVSAVPLVVSIPGAPPSGQAFNDTTGFTVPGTAGPALFIFAGLGGGVSAWNQSAGTTAVNVAQVAGASYTGLAVVHSPFGPLVLATDFHNGRVDVYNSAFSRLPVGLLFRDGNLPKGYAPFNVSEIGNQVFVTYAKQDANRQKDVAGAGHGFVDVYTNYGVLVHRLASRGALNSPWGLAVAPSTFGTFAGDLLVGNFGDGRIHAYDLHSGRFQGTLNDKYNHAIVIRGLWGLLVGDAVAGGPNSVWFSAGPGNEKHGLLGLLNVN